MREYMQALLLESGTLSTEDILLRILASAAFGAAIYLSYWYTHTGTTYSKKFNVSLVTLAILTGTVMTVIGNNVALSLGMVGALSIIRFRTSVKEPLDIMYMFWAVGAGIAIGAGMAGVAVIATLAVGLAVLFLTRGRQNGIPYILVLTVTDREAEKAALSLVEKNVRKCRIKSKSVTKGATEITVDLRLNKENTDFMHELTNLPNVISAVLVTYNGEYMT